MDDLAPPRGAPAPIPAYALYGEQAGDGGPFPDVLHLETIPDRAALHDWEVGDHRHAALAQFLLLTAGGAEARMDGAARRIGPGTGVFNPPLCVHGFDFDEGADGWVLSIEAARLGAAPEGPAVIDPGPEAAAELAALFRLAAAEHAAARPGRAEALAALAELIGRHFARAAGRGAGREDPSAALARAYLAWLEEHYRTQPSVADAAAALGVTATHLSRVCRQVTGRPASAHLHARLALEAKRLLVYTPMQVAQIGFSLGFADPAWFSRFFAKHAGLPPSKFRAAFG
ncbi:helix-turn-helix domain-containing protein [Rhodovulum sp. DZ06]|uniref:helix-turn-helix domain-containing protein n=1 Tax=Rhodovulum sp. DZ06 TaxID=3425126 RepID=UPI003D335294